MEYSNGFRSRMVQRMAGPRPVSATTLARETGVPQPTLSRWLREAPTLPPMDGRDDKGSSRPKQWTAEEKLRVVLAAAQLSEAQLGEFLRGEGLHAAQLEEWRQVAMAGAQSALSGRKPAAKNTPETTKIRALERDLDRKNRALAELAALLALQTKIPANWGAADESTPPKTET